MSYAVVVTTVTEEVAAPASGESLFSPEAVPVRTQLVRDTVTGSVSEWGIYDRTALEPEAVITGPAIVAENETSTLIGRAGGATVNGLGYLELTRAD